MHITVLGGGISGLATAWKLSDEHQVDVVEKTGKTGGMASTFRYKDFYLDYGPHKVYTQLPGVIEEFKELVGPDLLTQPKVNKLMVEGKLFDFPIKITQLLTRLNPVTAAKCGFSVFGNFFHKEKGQSYEVYFKNNFGNAMYDLLFKQYAQKVWGDPKNLSEELARRRVPVSNFTDMLKGILFGVKKEQNAEEFYYPKYGIGTVCDRMVERIEKNKGTIKTHTILTNIRVENNKVVEVTEKTKEGKESKTKTDYLVSTIPITMLPFLISPAPPKEVLQAAKNLKYRALIVLYIIVDKERALDANWIFFPGADIVFNRLSEKKSFSKYTCPKGKTVLMAEITCDFNDWRWNASDYDIYEMVIKDLERHNFIKASEVDEYFTRKAANVYPVYDKEHRRNMNIILGYLDTIENLQTTGRQGLFNYNNTDHCIDMAKKTAEYIKEGKQLAEWRELRDYFDSYRIVD